MTNERTGEGTPERERILREMGLGPVWKLRVMPAAAPLEPVATSAPAVSRPPPEIAIIGTPGSVLRISLTASMPSFSGMRISEMTSPGRCSRKSARPIAPFGASMTR